MTNKDQKDKIRQRMAETGESWADARRSAFNEHAGENRLGPETIRFIKDVLLSEIAYHEAVASRLRELEEQGYTIIAGGQTSSPDEDGRSDWSFQTYRTGETIASGHGTIDEVDGQFLSGLHFDQVTLSIPLPDCPRPPHDMPISLADSLRSWVFEADPEELAMWIGWPVERVSRALPS